MAELFLKHDSFSYLFDTQLLKLHRLEGIKSVEINNPEIMRDVQLFSAEISREQAFKMAAEEAHNYNVVKTNSENCADPVPDVAEI